MISIRASLAFFLAAAAVAAPAFATPTHRKAPSAHSHSTGATHHASSRSASLKSASTKSRKGRSRHQKLHGQQGIDSTRATEIQQALIREHYLNGEPSGQWDSATVTAMPLDALRFAVPRTLVLDGLDATVARAFERTLATLAAAGAPIASVALAALRVNCVKQEGRLTAAFFVCYSLFPVVKTSSEEFPSGETGSDPEWHPALR